jgi:hypothetical protein
MTGIEAAILMGDQKSLTEVCRRRDQLLDFHQFGLFLVLSGRYLYGTCEISFEIEPYIRLY